MPTTTKQAKVLADHELRKLREYVKANSQMPERDDLMFLLTFHAGLRASEIAKLDIDAMTDASGYPANRLIVDSKVGKGGRAREVPMTPFLIDALIRFRARYPEATYVAIGTYKRGQRMSANSVARYMWTILHKAGLAGASSHSGRRTYITNLARRANLHGGSLRDVQVLAGHASLATTEKYVELNPAVYAMTASLAA
jgi:integrase